MADGDADKKKKTIYDFIAEDRARLYGSQAQPQTTLAVNNQPPSDGQSTTTAKPSDITGDGMPSGGTGAPKGEKSTVDEILGAPSYEEALGNALRKREVAKQKLDNEMKALTGKVKFNSKGEPTRININGVWTDIDSALAMPEDVESALDRYYGVLYDYNSAEEEVKLVKELKSLIGGKTAGAGTVIDEEKEFRDKVKFYANLAKDILSMQRTAVSTTFEGLKDSADLMAKIKSKGVLVPGQQVYIPPTPQQNMWKPLADMAGLPMGVTGQPVPREVYNNPDEYAKMLGVPGYAKGTPAKNNEFGMMRKNNTRFSALINMRSRR